MSISCTRHSQSEALARTSRTPGGDRVRPTSSRVLRGALTAGAAAGLIVTATMTPAQAASGYDRCPWGRLCVFSGPLGKGQMLVVKGSRLSLASRFREVRRPADDQVSEKCP